MRGGSDAADAYSVLSNPHLFQFGGRKPPPFPLRRAGGGGGVTVGWTGGTASSLPVVQATPVPSRSGCRFPLITEPLGLEVETPSDQQDQAKGWEGVPEGGLWMRHIKAPASRGTVTNRTPSVGGAASTARRAMRGLGAMPCPSAGTAPPRAPPPPPSEHRWPSTPSSQTLTVGQRSVV